MAAEASARAAHALGDPIIAAAIKRPQHRLSRGTVAPVELFSGIRALAELVSTCAGEGRPTSAPGASRDQAVLLLELETLDGKVRIVDAAVQTRGSASEAVIRCAQRELRGQEIAVEISQSGGRFQLPFTLRI